MTPDDLLDLAVIDDRTEPEPLGDEVGRWHRACRAALERDDHPPARMTVVLVDPDDSAALHGTHFGEPSPTDVMSFPDGTRDPADGRILIGDVVVCPAVAASRRATGPEIADEVFLYVVHGLLHCLGHDDVDEADRALMWQLQAELLAPFGITVRDDEELA